jgi:hypothetical protein
LQLDVNDNSYDNNWEMYYKDNIEESDLDKIKIKLIPSPPSIDYESYHLALLDNNKCKNIPIKTTIVWIIKEEFQIKNNNKEKKILKSYIKNFIESKDIKITNSNRHCYHIRFNLEGTLKDFNSLFKDIDIEVILSKHSCSSKSITYILKAIQEIDNIPQNTELYWVNNEISQSNTGSNLFATKDLSPDSLQVTDKLYNTDELINDVSEIISNKYAKEISIQLIDLLKYAQNKSLQITLDKQLTFTNDDLAVISKDYGEILSAIWVMSNLNFSKVLFPKNSNEKLIDFYGKKVSVCYPISVKSGSGSKVFLKNILDAINKRKKLSKKNINEQPSLGIIKIASNNTMKSQMIILHQFLKTKMIKDLSIILDKSIDEITIEYVKDWTNNKTVEELKIILMNWWRDYSMPRKFNMNDNERLVISPLGEKIKFILNEDKKLKDSLTYLAKNIALLQINIDVSYDQINFKKSFFKDSEFKFDWQGYSSGNRLGFKKN